MGTVIGTLLQFGMFYFTQPLIGDSMRYFAMADAIRQGTFKPFLFPLILALSPFKYLVTGILVQLISYQIMMWLVYKSSKSQTAVILACLGTAYQSTFVMTETLLAVLILWAVYWKNLVPVFLAVSLKTMTLGNFLYEATHLHYYFLDQLLKTLSFPKVWVILSIILLGFYFGKGLERLVLLYAFILLMIPTPPASFVRYSVPILPICAIAIGRKYDEMVNSFSLRSLSL